MNDLRYALIRFVPNMARMEPINVGVILQGSSRLDLKFNAHVSKQKRVDTDIFKKWRSFFEEEVTGTSVPLFQPPKDSPRFFEHLAKLCEDTMSLTPALIYQPQDACDSFDSILGRLYDELVAPPDQDVKEQSSRPTSVYRVLEEQYGFMKRGMRRHSYVSWDTTKHWNAYREIRNGENIVIDKIEVDTQIGKTADEIQKLSSGVGSFIGDFLRKQGNSSPSPRYLLLADPLEQKFTDQTPDDFNVMLEEYGKVINLVKSRGGEVVQDHGEVQSVAGELNKKLPPHEPVLSG